MSKVMFSLPVFACLMIGAGAHADPGLALLKGPEWKGECRQLINEAGKTLVGHKSERLQSGYAYKHDLLIWTVTNFNDAKCLHTHEANRFTLLCTARPKDETAKCKQMKAETSRDGMTWADSQSSGMMLNVGVKKKAAELEITTIGDSGAADHELLKPGS